jgi:hypothetical protein
MEAPDFPGMVAGDGYIINATVQPSGMQGVFYEA